MDFSGILFLIYFLPLALGGYYVLSFSKKAQNVWMFFVSIVFCAWGEPVHLFLLLFSIVWNWAAGLLLACAKGHPQRKKVLLIVACSVDLGILIGFRYPALAFYTLQVLSYVTDVYRNEIKAEKNILHLGLYVAFFPRLPAGPLMRYQQVAQQIRDRKSDLGKISVGMCRLLTGLGKKILLADNLAALADVIFQWSEMGVENMQVPAVMAWMGIIAYTLQIYFDLSGYSDMAIGLGSLFGFKFEENFNYPYTAVSLRDFWNRWHISLMGWFCEYVYYPLGGNCVTNKDKMVRNLAIVWLLIGIWHGIGWNFLFWGIWHFLFQVAERFWDCENTGEHRSIKHLYTLSVVAVGWVLIRTNNLYQANIYYKNMLGINGNGIWNDTAAFLLREYWIFMAAGAILCTPLAKRWNTWLIEKGSQKTVKMFRTLCLPTVVLLLCVANMVGHLEQAQEMGKELLKVDSLEAFAAWKEETQEQAEENILGKTELLEGYGWIQKILHKREYGHFTYIKNDNGMMFYGSLADGNNSDLEAYAQNVRRLKETVEAGGAKLIVLLPPSKLLQGVNNVYPNLPVNDPNARMDKFLNLMMQNGVFAIDLRVTMQKSGESAESLFFKTDHQWTPLAAFYATKELVEQVERRYQDDWDPEGYYTNLDHYHTRIYEKAMLGSYGRNAGINYSGMEDYCLLWPSCDMKFSWTDHETDNTQKGTFENAFFSESALNIEDVYSKGIHDVYLNGITDHDRIVNESNVKGPKLAVLRDAYFSPMACFLAPMCSEIEMVWNKRSSNDIDYEKFVKESDADYVILEIYPYNLNADSFDYFK